MSTWSLPEVLASVHDDVEQELNRIRKTLAHSTSKGDASEDVWIDLCNRYLPHRYRAAKAFVVDSNGAFSDQIDVVVYDRQYSPLIFEIKGEKVIAAESVYAVFEAKQSANAPHISYAHAKAQSVRALHRTTLPIPHAGGEYPPKPPHHILAGLLALESDWAPALGDTLRGHLTNAPAAGRLDIGCIAAHGYFVLDKASGKHTFHAEAKHATAFLYRLVSILQQSATVPMIDVQAYAAWLYK